jgi:integrase
MASKKSRLGQYLEWHRGHIRVTVPVPKAVQASVGSTRLKRPLHTDSPANAERIKHAVIHELKALISAAEKPREGLVGEAIGWRNDLDSLRDKERDTLELVLLDRAEEIELKSGLSTAREFVAIAHGQATPISTLLDSYLVSCGLAARTKDGIKRTVRVYEDWATASGEPTAVEAINRKVAGRFVSGHLLPRMEPQSAGTYTKFLSGYWKFLEGKGYADTNPWTGQLQGVKQARRRRSILLDIETNGSGGKRPYTDEEALALLYADATNETDRRTLDLMWIGALSGMRIDEICGLRVRNCDGGWFDVNADGKGKTAAAKRRVPIHSELASIVARRCAHKNPDAYLFDDLPEPPEGSIRERSMPASKAYTRFRRRLKIDERSAGQRQSNVDFHSWRRWFIRKARDARQGPWTIADVVGHDTKDLPLGLTMGGYPGRADDEALRECVEAVRIPVPEALAA